MTPRSASLRVAHQAHCPNASRSSLDSVDKACKAAGCKPSYFTFHRGHDGRARKSARVRDRRLAEKMLRELQVEIDKGRAGWEEERNVEFPEWCAEFLRQTEARVANGLIKRRTLDAYRETIDRFAIPAIGWVNLRMIGAPQLRAFHEATTETGGTSTQLRHLRHLNVVLSTAVDEGLLNANPLPPFKRRLHLRAPGRGKAPFEDGELERLWAAYRQHMEKKAKPWAPVYLYAAQFSAETGLRIGELAALDYDSIRGTSVRVKHTWNSTDGLIPPKDREQRDVYLTQWALDVLAAWLPIRGDHDGPLFPSPQGGRLSIRELQRKLRLAMATAGIPKLHPEIELPRSFHSLRYSTSNLLQRRGFAVRFIEQMLGHSSIELTLNTYGKWTPAQLAAEAARIVPEG